MRLNRFTPFLVAPLLFGAPSAHAQIQPPGLAAAPSLSLSAIQAADSLNDQATQAYQAKDWARAAELWTRMAQTPDVPSAATAHYNAACALALGGNADAAFRELRAALAAGSHDAGLLQNDSDLASLHADARWAALVADASAAAEAYRRDHSDPERARLLTSDIDLFWRAYDLAKAEPDAARKVEIFRREYVERASPGYLDYFLSKIHSVESLSRFVTQNQAYYDGVRASTAGVAALEPGMRQAFRRMKELYPDAFFPEVTFGIGRLTSGGTVSPRGLLLGTEMYGVVASTPVDGLPQYARNIVSPITELPHTVAHELVHFEQTDGGDHTLLKGVLKEGGADFIGELILPGGREPEYRTWGRAHEAQVWARFSAEMHNPRDGLWIGSAGQRITEWGGWPGDLGYFVGYQIAKAYYDRAADKKQAIADLLKLQDPDAILRASGYAERFASSAASSH